MLILSVARKHFAHNGEINRHYWHDTGAAMANFSVQVTALGLHASLHGRLRPREGAGGLRDSRMILRQSPSRQLATSAIQRRLPEELRKSEEPPRQRKDLKEFVFSEWEKPAF